MVIKGLLPVLFVSLAACSSAPAPAPVVPKQAAHVHNPHDHNHSRGKMLMASDGTTTALLTAHLSSKTGNELDIFVERDGKPYALKTTTATAKAKDTAGTEKTIAFECAPRDERPATEADDACSHFVAKAPWITPGQPLRVESTLPLETSTEFVWRDFEAKKYAHHEE